MIWPILTQFGPNLASRMLGMVMYGVFSAARFQLAEPRSCQSFVVTTVTVTVTVTMNLTKILQILSFFSTSFSLALALALALLSFSIA